MSLTTQVHRGYGSGSLDAIVRRGFAAYTGLPQPPASGYQYQTCSTLSYTGYSLEAGVSSAVAVGDVFIPQLVTSPSDYSLSVNGDGTVDILSGGNTARQMFLWDLYRLSANAISGVGEVWIDEIGPIWGSLIYIPSALLGGVISINLAGATYATSPEGDTLVFSLASGSLPPGVTLLSSGSLFGTYITVGTYNFTIEATDITGTSVPSPASQIIVNPQPPPVSGVAFISPRD